jgi:ElaB/YqjD/DUF883 family membrane-anchored ribosome-binding protein
MSYYYGVWCSVNGGQLCGCAKGNPQEVQADIQLLIDNKQRVTDSQVAKAGDSEKFDKLVAKVKHQIEAETQKVLTKDKKVKTKARKYQIDPAGFTPESILAQQAQYETIRLTQQHRAQ